MNTTKMNNKRSTLCSLIGLGLSVLAFSPVISNAQVRAITKANTFWAKGAGTTYSVSTPFLGRVETSKFGSDIGRSDNNLTLQNFTTDQGKVYGMSSTLPTTVSFRRVNNSKVSGVRQQMFFQNVDSSYNGSVSPNPFLLKPSYSDDMTDAFSGRILNRGSDNIFGNVNENYGNYNDIERIDIVFQAPQLVSADEGNGAVIFERGSVGNHGTVKLAAILSVDAGGNPTSYSAITTVVNTDWGSNDVTDVYNWAVYRRDAATQPLMVVSNDWVGLQSLGGVFVPYSSFGLSAGTTIYGYSIIPADFTGATSADILNYTDNTLYPLTTDAANGAGPGGIDIIGVTGSFVETKTLPQTLSGTVFHDANGLTDSTVNGTGIGIIDGKTLYVNVIDPGADTVVATAVVGGNGTWTASGIPANTTYQVQVSTVAGTVGSTASLTTLTGKWADVGEHIGLTAGDDGNANGSISVQVDLSAVTDIDFGIEQTPTANTQSYNISVPARNSTMVLNGTGALNSPGMLTGTDPEDGVLNASKTIRIGTLPANGTLLYDGVAVVAAQEIQNYDPSKLAVQFTGTGTSGWAYSTVQFSYSFKDAAGLSGASGTYAINMAQPLGLKLTSFTGAMVGDADVLNWITTDEKNMDKFEVEFSADAVQFKTIGSVSAKNTAGTNTYQYTAPTANGNRYYRLKMDETDGKTTYSNVVVLSADGKTGKMTATVTPNPVGTNATTHLTILHEKAGKMGIKIFNQAGQSILVSEEAIPQGSTTIDINTAAWAPGIYFVLLTDQSTGEHTTIKIVK